MQQSASVLSHSSEVSFYRHRGTLNIRVGPMYSGKSTWLNGELAELADKGLSSVKIRHSSDVRGDVHKSDAAGSTHNSGYNSLSSKVRVIIATKLRDIPLPREKVIGIDESQFFPDLLEVVTEWVEEKGKHVRVAGLDGDSDKRKFGQTLDLIPMCDEIIKLSASCRMCLDELKAADFHGNILAISGPFTKCLVPKQGQTLVGGSDLYVPACRYHHSNGSK
jgi:thymidine kinase